MRRVVAEEAISANSATIDEDDQPPVIPRYDPPPESSTSQQQQRTPVPIRQVYTGQQVIRAVPTKGNVIYLKSADNLGHPPQKMVVRGGGGKPNSGEAYSQGGGVYHAPGTVLSGGARVVAVRGGQGGAAPIRQIYTGNHVQQQNGQNRYVRVQNPAPPRGAQEPIMRRVVQHRGGVDYMELEQGVSPNQRYVMQPPGPSNLPPRLPKAVVPRGGLTMQMMQQQQQQHYSANHRRLLNSRAKPRTTITYGDFMASRGIQDGSKFMMHTKPQFLPFEFNEEEEREINEAIAREEEWMRLEEENKIGGYDSSGTPIRTFAFPSELNRAPPYVSNLLPSPNDTQDEKAIKQCLDTMFSQVCRWDRMHGWSKMHFKKARAKSDSEKIHLRKARLTQREVMISEHMERLKKEINKRRTKMENEAEQQCGLLTPWRKSRARPNRTAKPKAEVKKEVINPADITLGGDTYDYVKDEKPDMDESIATTVSRRRRTSANLSKSEDDNEKHRSSSQDPSHPTRGTKERRTSLEPPSTKVSAYYPGTPVPMDIDMAIAHCTCNQQFDANKHYIQCDMCARWYHGECVEIPEKRMIKMEAWTCEQCLEEQERVKDEPALYCVCKTPYDDTKFYVGCDSCQGWFHPECVGTTREDAEQAAEYNCPECTREGGYESEGSDSSTSSRTSNLLTRQDYGYVNELLELLNEHRMNTPFRNPVDLKEFPDYTHFIKKPMDLSIIGKKVQDIEYQYLGNFVNDVTLMFENAKTYNPKDSAIFKCAETMQEVFDKKLLEVRERIREQTTARHQMDHFQQNPEMGLARKRVQSESQKTVDSLDIDPDQLLPFDPSVMSFFGYQ